MAIWGEYAEKRRLANLEEYKAKSADELFRQHGIVFYSPLDIQTINSAILKIREVLEKYETFRDETGREVKNNGR